MALVYFGVKLDGFLEYTPIEFNKLLEIKEQEKINNFREKMEIMRIQTMPLVNVHIAPKDRSKTVQSFMPFEWDKKIDKNDDGVIEMTEDDWDDLDKKFPANKLNK